MIQITCDHCRGKGQIPLHESLAATLKFVRNGRRTAEQIHAASGEAGFIAVTAINNRLERLRSYGLVTRHREGKYFHYAATKIERKHVVEDKP